MERVLKFLTNILAFILGASFNALIFIVLAWAIFTFAERGFEFGQEFSYRLTTERESYEVEFVLAEDTSVAVVAQMLEDLGIIESAWMYRIELMLMGAPEYYEAGTYILNKNMSTTQINNRLRAIVVEPNQITIREGWTQRDIGLYLESRGFFTLDEFMYVANNHDFGFRFLEDLPYRPRRTGESRLEGYLFPDTYLIPPNPTPVDVITRMLSRFNEVFTFDYRLRAEELGMTMDEIVIIASMIEREVRVPEERPMVSRVIHNRLAQNMRLQIDATIHYAMDRHLERTLYVHTQYDSPFNTYMVDGLPLGPISNPGAASIRAALFPATGNWLFYVLVDAETGAHFFTHSYAEHQHAVEHYMPRPWED